MKRYNAFMPAFIIIMAALLLASCASAQSPTATSSLAENTTTSGSTTQSNEPSTTTEATSAEPEDLGKLLLVLPDWSGGTYEYDDENEIVLNELKKRLLEDRNQLIDIETMPYPGASFMDKLNTILAGGEPIDAFGMWYPWNGFLGYASKPGLAADLTDKVKEYPNIISTIPQISWDAVTLNNRIFAIPDYQLPQTHGIYVRKDILDEAGLPVPTTIQEMENALEAITNAGLMGLPCGMQYLDRAFCGAFELPFANYKESDGFVNHRLFHPNFEAYIELLRNWYAKGYIVPDFMTINLEQQQQFLSSGRAGASIGWYSWMTNDYPIIKDAYPDADIAVTLVLDAGYQNGGIELEAAITNYLMPLAKSDKIDSLLAFLDWRWSSYENTLICEKGVNGIHYTLDLPNLTISPGIDKYNDPTVQKYGGLYYMYIGVNVFPPLTQISEDPVKQYGIDLTTKQQNNLADAIAKKPVPSATLGKPLQLDDDIASLEGEYTEAYGLLLTEAITGIKTMEEFKSGRDDLIPMWKPVGDAYTTALKELE